MPGFLKDDLTVALDEVDRIASRIITIYRDLAAVADEPAAAPLLEEAQCREAALRRYNEARQAHGQIPEVDDPERGHLQALWLKLKSLLASPNPAAALAHSLDELDQELRRAIASARALQPDADVSQTMEQLLPPPDQR
ncbi:MAG: hypothetical protein ACNA7W_08545 [Pseudomonadales bacterium]